MIDKDKFRSLVARAVDRQAPGAEAASGRLWKLIERPANQQLRKLQPDFGRLTRARQEDLRDEFLILIVEHAAAVANGSFEDALRDATYYWYRKKAHERE